MPRRTKRLPEKLYASTVSWEGWVFRVLSSADGVRWLDLHPTPLESLEEKLGARIVPDDQQNERVLTELHSFLRGELRKFTVPVDLRGTEFQCAVWNAIAAIPYGQTTSYGELADSIQRPKATRAVGQATGANPVPIIIPCHRVIGSSGGLTGFGGGLPLKERLLGLERGTLSL
ncbi:methylated-DNA--[protein]-cysteine S-methyltransferase [Candidatus Bipolaricaulota bacterium]